MTKNISIWNITSIKKESDIKNMKENSKATYEKKNLNQLNIPK